jgi:hypothetical protein
MRLVSVHRTFPVEVRFEATNGSIPLLPPRTHTSDGRMDVVSRMAVVPLHAVIPNRSYSELETERYVCVVEGLPVCYAIGAVEDIRRNLAYDPQLGEKRSRGRRVND